MNEQPSPLERRVLKRLVEGTGDPVLRGALMKQLDEISVVGRTGKDFGYYTDFQVPHGLRVPHLTDEVLNRSPLVIETTHPDGENGLVFVLYFKGGLISFLESASTTTWPENENEVLNPSD